MFLASEKKLPDRIVFLDDGLENLESVGSTAKALKIPFVGIHVTGIEGGGSYGGGGSV